MGRVRSVAVVALATVAAVGVVSAATATVTAEVLTVNSGDRSTPLVATPPEAESGGRKGRIVGGRTVSDVDPDTGSQFFAKIFTPDGKGFFCGGSLVSFKHVLTRAGCNVFPGDVVRVGGAKLFDGLTFRVGKVTAHPSFNPVGDVHDIAVIELANAKSEAAMIKAGVVPVAMNKDFGTPHGFYVTGFGATDEKAETAGSLQLKRGYQPLRSWAMCKEVFDQVRLPSGKLLPINTSAQVCTNYKSPESGALCERDVGGPMFRADTQVVGGVKTKVYTLYAVASFWIGTAKELCPQGLPNVGTKVAHYTKWIQAAMA